MSITHSQMGAQHNHKSKTIDIGKGKRLLFLFIFTFLLTTLAALTVYYPIWLNIPINIVIPIILLLLKSTNTFAKIKLATLTIGRVIIALTALAVIPGHLCVQIILWLLRINIAEAIIKDIKEKHIWNSFAGSVVLFSSFLIEGTWMGKFFLTHPDSLIFWALAYTVWNWNFVNLNFPRTIGYYHITVLLSPLIFCLATFETGFWLIMRATTLTIAGSLQIKQEKEILKYLHSDFFIEKTEFRFKKYWQVILFSVTSSFALLAYVFI